MKQGPATTLYWEEFRDYAAQNSMSKYESRLLREWVRSGHSVYETIESRYLPGPAYPAMDFLDAYRFDRELSKNMRGMTRSERTAYLQEFMSYEETPPEELAQEDARKHTPKLFEDRIRHLERELFHLWEYIWQEGLGDEAREFMEEHKNDEMPFEW